MTTKEVFLSLTICLFILYGINSVASSGTTTVSIKGDNPVSVGDKVIISCQCQGSFNCIGEAAYFSIGSNGIYLYEDIEDLSRYATGTNGNRGITESWHNIVLRSATEADDGTTYQCTMGNTGWDRVNSVIMKVNAGGYSVNSSAVTGNLLASTSTPQPSNTTESQVNMLHKPGISALSTALKTSTSTPWLSTTNREMLATTLHAVEMSEFLITTTRQQVTSQSTYSEATTSLHLQAILSTSPSSPSSLSPSSAAVKPRSTDSPMTTQVVSSALSKSNESQTSHFGSPATQSKYDHVTVTQEHVTASPAQDDAPTYVYVAVASGVGIVVYILTIVLIGLVISLKIKARTSQHTANTSRSRPDQASPRANWDSFAGVNTNAGSLPMVPMVSNPVYNEVLTPMSPAPPYYKEDPSSLFEGRQVVVNLDSRYHDVPQRKSVAAESLYDYIDMQ